jgi:hypothetical protein
MKGNLKRTGCCGKCHKPFRSCRCHENRVVEDVIDAISKKVVPSVHECDFCKGVGGLSSIVRFQDFLVHVECFKKLRSKSLIEYPPKLMKDIDGDYTDVNKPNRKAFIKGLINNKKL